jgi:hypothetical protein
VFVLAFVVEVVVGYNPFMHKTQPQKLIFLAFCGFFSGSHTQPQPPPQIQTHTTLEIKLKAPIMLHIQTIEQLCILINKIRRSNEYK